MTNDAIKSQEQRLRCRAKSLDFRIEKSPGRTYHSGNRGDYMLIDNRLGQNTPILGWDYDAPLDQIEEFLENYAGELAAKVDLAGEGNQAEFI